MGFSFSVTAEAADRFCPEQCFKGLDLVAKRLIRSTHKLSVRDIRIFERRIESAIVYFGRASYQFKLDNLQEAQRLARASFLEWDFAKQIALTKLAPQYREIEI